MKKITSLLLLLLVVNLSSPSPIQAQNQNAPPQEKTNDQVRTPPSSDSELPKELAEELKRAEEQGDSQFFQKFMDMLFTLGVIIAFVVLFMWILKRMLSVRVGQVNKTCTIKILERRSLTPKTSIYVLGVFGKAVAIADSINGVTVLTELSKSEVREESGQTTEASPRQVTE